MALPKIDTPVYEVELPLSKKQIRFRPFLVKEQKLMLMVMEERNPEEATKITKQIGFLTDFLLTLHYENYFHQ